jgi:hypothetical protein
MIAACPFNRKLSVLGNGAVPLKAYRQYEDTSGPGKVSQSRQRGLGLVGYTAARFAQYVSWTLHEPCEGTQSGVSMS